MKQKSNSLKGYNVKEKSFFMGSILTPLIVGGIIAAVSCAVYTFNKSFEVGFFFSVLTVLVIGSLINFAKADKIGITFFSFLLIPARYRYSDIIALNTIKPKHDPEAPGITLLFLKNGKRKLLKLGLYPLKTQQKILALLTENVTNCTEHYHDRKRWDIWFAHAKKRVVSRRLFIGVLLILIGLSFQVKTWIWDWKVSHWHHTKALILINQQREKETPPKFEYTYTYKDKDYTGNRIVGDAKSLDPDCKPKTTIKCIVNPESPEESALLTPYRADWLMSAGGLLLILIGLPFLFLAVIYQCKKINIPEELKKYPENFNRDELAKIALQICGECKISVGKISGCYREIDGRYGCFPPFHSILSLLVQAFFFALSILIGTTLMPHFLLVALMILVLFWKTLFPRGVVFDRSKKKIYWFRFFSCKSIPEKLKRNDVLKDADLIALGLTIRNDGSIMLSGVRKDGVYIPIATAKNKYMEQLLSDTIIIANNLGKLPITII